MQVMDDIGYRMLDQWGLPGSTRNFSFRVLWFALTDHYVCGKLIVTFTISLNERTNEQRDVNSASQIYSWASGVSTVKRRNQNCSSQVKPRQARKNKPETKQKRTDKIRNKQTNKWQSQASRTSRAHPACRTMWTLIVPGYSRWGNPIYSLSRRNQQKWCIQINDGCSIWQCIGRTDRQTNRLSLNNSSHPISSLGTSYRFFLILGEHWQSLNLVWLVLFFCFYQLGTFLCLCTRIHTTLWPQERKKLLWNE